MTIDHLITSISACTFFVCMIKSLLCANFLLMSTRVARIRGCVLAKSWNRGLVSKLSNDVESNQTELKYFIWFQFYNLTAEFYHQIFKYGLFDYLIKNHGSMLKIILNIYIILNILKFVMEMLYVNIKQIFQNTFLKNQLFSCGP